MNTFRKMLDEGAQTLHKNGIDTYRQDAQMLMQNVRGCDKAEMILKENEIVNDENHKLFFQYLEKRIERQSVSRIVGNCEFYGINLEISQNVLEPRSDTECLIDAVLRQVKNKFTNQDKLQFADLGTGSGAIVIALLDNLPNATAVATDICKEALEVAGRNAEKCGVRDRLTLQQGNWTQGLGDKTFDFVVSNPPYIVKEEIQMLPPQVLYDPIVALDGGEDGLNAYREIMGKVQNNLKYNGFFACEIGYNQLNSITYISKENGWDIIDYETDLGGHTRSVIVEREDKKGLQ